MQVYFEMLDALLAEEKIPDEYSGKTQVCLVSNFIPNLSIKNLQPGDGAPT